ncbi:MAG: dipicolinate synthase subunit B, partial [Ruminiclostridium sp.]|nr:dipicolinate synthase subunit B [Ruminiclostridium sp.]
MEEIRVGFALTGSFCTLEKTMAAMEETAARYPHILPILSETTAGTDTRFGRAEEWKERVEAICGPGYIGSVRE